MGIHIWKNPSEALINTWGNVAQKQKDNDLGEGETRIQTDAIK